MKKALSLVLVGLILVSLLVGCGNANNGEESTTSATTTEATTDVANDANDGKKVSVTLWTLSTRKEAADPIVEEFNKNNKNYEMKISYYETDAIKDACKVAASSGTLPNAWFNWGGSLASFYVDNGCTYDLTDYAKAHEWNDTFNTNALDLCTFDGKLSGYPESYNILGVYYRKDLFEKYNVNVPTTFEEFENACATLKSNGITPISTAGINGWHVMRFVELFIEHYAGAELHDKLNTFDENYNCEPVVQALTKYQEFCDKGYFPEGFITTDPNDVNIPLFSGKAAMDIEGQWYDGTLIQNEQDINNWGVFSIPTSGTNRLSSFGDMTQFNAKNTDDEMDACVAYLDYYNSDENVAKYTKFYSQPLPRNGAKMPDGQPNVPILMDMGKNNGTFTITDQAFPTEVADALFSVQDALANHQMTPQDGAAKIADAIDAYKNKK